MYKHTLRATSFHHTTIATNQLSGEQILGACRQLDDKCATKNVALTFPLSKTLTKEQSWLRFDYQIRITTYMHTACKSHYL